MVGYFHLLWCSSIIMILVSNSFTQVNLLHSAIPFPYKTFDIYSYFIVCSVYLTIILLLIILRSRFSFLLLFYNRHTINTYVSFFLFPLQGSPLIFIPASRSFFISVCGLLFDGRLNLTSKAHARLYLPSCMIQGSSKAHSVLSPYLHISNISLKSCILVAVTTSSILVHSRYPQFYVENCTFWCPLDTDSF